MDNANLIADAESVTFRPHWGTGWETSCLSGPRQGESPVETRPDPKCYRREQRFVFPKVTGFPWLDRLLATTCRGGSLCPPALRGDTACRS